LQDSGLPARISHRLGKNFPFGLAKYPGSRPKIPGSISQGISPKFTGNMGSFGRVQTVDNRADYQNSRFFP
jgi:hypothetical protein